MELGEAEGIGEAELGPVVEESQTKLYEDYLHDLGLATLVLRFRRHERGWEARRGTERSGSRASGPASSAAWSRTPSRSSAPPAPR